MIDEDYQELILLEENAYIYKNKAALMMDYLLVNVFGGALEYDRLGFEILTSFYVLAACHETQVVWKENLGVVRKPFNPSLNQEVPFVIGRVLYLLYCVRRVHLRLRDDFMYMIRYEDVRL